MIYAGALVLAVTNSATGATTSVDTGGTSVVAYRPGGAIDRDSSWYAAGPAMFGFRAGLGNRPRGLYVFDGLYTVNFAADGYKTVTVLAGGEQEICALID